MEYITVDEDGNITGHFCGKTLPDGAIQVPDSFQGRKGQNTAEFDSEMNLRPLADRVADRLVTVPDGYKVSGEEIRRMELPEIMEAYDPVYIASEGSYECQKIWKWFDADGNFTLTIPDGYTEMSGEQPSSAYKAEGGEWVFDLEKAQEMKRAEIKQAFNEACETAHCTSSLGFEIDADETANRNIEGLVLVMDDGDTTLFRDYNNTYQTVSKSDLETMRKEIVANSQNLYQAKWALEAAVDEAEDEEDMDGITIAFLNLTR